MDSAARTVYLLVTPVQQAAAEKSVVLSVRLAGPEVSPAVVQLVTPCFATHLKAVLLQALAALQPQAQPLDQRAFRVQLPWEKTRLVGRFGGSCGGYGDSLSMSKVLTWDAFFAELGDAELLLVRAGSCDDTRNRLKAKLRSKEQRSPSQSPSPSPSQSPSPLVAPSLSPSPSLLPSPRNSSFTLSPSALVPLAGLNISASSSPPPLPPPSAPVPAPTGLLTSASNTLSHAYPHLHQPSPPLALTAAETALPPMRPVLVRVHIGFAWQRTNSATSEDITAWLKGARLRCTASVAAATARPFWQ
eukprot:TRINITY_DN4574_c0_g1_i9.p1 TRINITY_DN4574_c0_g1~~TRINITY_DN4574_c0_g1_i9.p1  ORF type:complete len:303 (-),score=90.09 TRINITY_DN4574_c0_g1_i9:558-1466(-)